MKCDCEIKINNIITNNLITSAETLTTDTSQLIEKYKYLNFEMKELIKLEQQLKLKEVLIDNRRVDILNIERRSNM